MDLSLWEPPDGDYHSSDESNYNVGYAVSLGYNTVFCHDVMEEEFMNERSCAQVLKIWMDKADEEIVELEEDILMLKCQLAWDDVDWSEPCSDVLREKINHLDILIQSLKNEVSEDVHFLALQIVEQSENLTQRLHELVEPLLENYLLVKSKQKQDAITCKHPANILICAADESGKDTNKLNELKEKMVTNSAPGKPWKFSSVKAEPPEPTVKASTASNASSRGKTEWKTTYKEVLRKKKSVRPKLEHEETHKIADTNCAIMENTKSENVTQLQQRQETLEINQAKPISTLTTGKKKVNPSGMDCNTSSTIDKKSRFTKNAGRFTMNDLKTIAKNQNLKGYSKLKKKELLKFVGLEEELLLSEKQRA